jgi:hypothetical protein
LADFSPLDWVDSLESNFDITEFCGGDGCNPFVGWGEVEVEDADDVAPVKANPPCTPVPPRPLNAILFGFGASLSRWTGE